MDKSDSNVGSPWALVAATALIGGALCYAASLWPQALLITGLSGRELISTSGANAQDVSAVHPLAELFKLVMAALIGVGVTAVHRHYHRDRHIPRSLLQAQVLLCVAGALVMVIIGNSVARAFGVAGAAGIVRFRTPVEDPKDTTILFLLVALGMACGVGLIEVAAIGAVFLCVALVFLDQFGEGRARLMALSLVASGKDFPTEHVNRILRSHVDNYEAREVVQGAEAVTKYVVTFGGSTPSLAWITQELMANGTAGLKSVSWTDVKKGSQ